MQDFRVARNKESFKQTAPISTSLHDVKAKIANQAQAAAAKAIKQKANLVADRTTPFTFGQVKEAWSAFALSMKKKGTSPLISILLEDGPARMEGNNVIVNLSNSVQGQHLNEIKPRLLKFIRDDLRNDLIDIKPEIVEEANQEISSKRLYTQQEKFSFLAEKYPVLNDLRSKLGLDIDG
ncbi:hypothetical protein V6R21_15360 [Limibacter armeniacum]|uniref:hypothetical protein n=1 Tax=Limibacter armeniacum TaxID=466084 RepID=UPI002FE6BB41